MILLGLDNESKVREISRYCEENGIQKVFVLSPEKFSLVRALPEAEHIDYPQIIMYKYFYRLLQEINNDTLVVINECLRTQNRYDLTYNCIRHFLTQTRHQIVFQYLPMIASLEDFMILFDFDTQSRFKRERFDPRLLKECVIGLEPVRVCFERVPIAVPESLFKQYELQKETLFRELGNKDSHTLPRNLYMIPGKEKLKHTRPDVAYVGRNNRFKIEGFQTYREADYRNSPYTVFEFPHNYIDFADFIALSRQTEFPVLVTPLKVDEWYLSRYETWAETLADAYTKIQ